LRQTGCHRHNGDDTAATTVARRHAGDCCRRVRDAAGGSDWRVDSHKTSAKCVRSGVTSSGGSGDARLELTACQALHDRDVSPVMSTLVMNNIGKEVRVCMAQRCQCVSLSDSVGFSFINRLYFSLLSPNFLFCFALFVAMNEIDAGSIVRCVCYAGDKTTSRTVEYWWVSVTILPAARAVYTVITESD
jgi:hypothetical protein